MMRDGIECVVEQLHAFSACIEGLEVCTSGEDVDLGCDLEGFNARAEQCTERIDPERLEELEACAGRDDDGEAVDNVSLEPPTSGPPCPAGAIDLELFQCVCDGQGNGLTQCQPDGTLTPCDCSPEAMAAADAMDDTVVGPSICGNGVLDPGEQCDGVDLQGQTCASMGLGSGALSCSPLCTFDIGQCRAS